MNVLAIDPGTNDSAWVVFNGRHIVEHAIESNEAMLARLSSGSWRTGHIQAVVLEAIESFGMAVGREVFETVFWTGRFFECAQYRTLAPERMTRRTVKLHLCQSARAQDSNIRAALIDRFGGEAAIGRRKTPGPLFGIKSHEWSAVAIAVTWWDLNLGTRAVAV